MQMMKNPSHPGAIIREDVINELGLTVVAMASRLGISRVALTRVLQGQAGISANLAVRLELAGISTSRESLSASTRPSSR
jgi:addiction module HigA family antidote